MSEETHKKELSDISFTEKVRFHSREYLKCFLYLESCESSENIFTKSFYAKLITSSHLLEDFLDFHGAINNSNWYFYRELILRIKKISEKTVTLRLTL